MEDFKKRLISEKDELNEKIVKLNQFINSENFNKIDKVQQSLLKTQLFVMRTYHSILEERIHHLGL